LYIGIKYAIIKKAIPAQKRASLPMNQPLLIKRENAVAVISINYMPYNRMALAFIDLGRQCTAQQMWGA